MGSRLMGAVAVGAVSMLVLPGVASAATGAKTPTAPGAAKPTTTAPSPTSVRGPVRGHIRLYLPDAFFLQRAAVTVPLRGLHVSGVVTPWVPGQSVTLSAFLGRHQIARVRLRLKPARSHHFGFFTYRLVSPHSGSVLIEAVHDRNRALMGFIGRRRLSALHPGASFGSTGPFVTLIQQRLAALHFWIPQTGVYDSGTGLALDAYHRLLGWGVSQSLDGRTISYLLNGWGRFEVRFPRDGRHAEGNLSKQLLALVDKGRVDYIFPISSGKPSTPTVLGSFHVYDRVPGYLPDGMYYSSFFIGGYAIHGYDPAPDYPASHGCMRLPIQDAIPVFNWLNYGDGVDVYY